MDVHKDSVMVAVLPDHALQPIAVDRLPNDLQVLRSSADERVRDLVRCRQTLQQNVLRARH
jgi:hypothetical protein